MLLCSTRRKTGLTAAALLVVGLLAALSPPAQPARVSGTVVDDCSGQPLAEAAVLVEGTTDGAITDSLGSFAFETDAGGEKQLQASLICYHTATRPVRLQPGHEERVDFRLVPTGDTLTDIVGNVIVCGCEQ